MYTNISHYRGLASKFNSVTHKDGIYFATDTKEIIVNGIHYGAQIKSIGPSLDNTKYIVTLTDDTTIELPIATTTAPGLMTPEQVTKLNNLSDLSKADVEEIDARVTTNTNDIATINSTIADMDFTDAGIGVVTKVNQTDGKVTPVHSSDITINTATLASQTYSTSDATSNTSAATKGYVVQAITNKISALDGTSTDSTTESADKYLVHTVSETDGVVTVERITKAVLATLKLDSQTYSASDTTTDQYASTKGYVLQAINSKIDAAQALRYKGTIGTGGTVTALPASHQVGDVYVVATADTYAGQVCEIGDMIICQATGTVDANADWTVVQTNINGAVTAANTLTSNTVMLGNGNRTVKSLANGTSNQVLSSTGSGVEWRTLNSLTISIDGTSTVFDGTADKSVTIEGQGWIEVE